jgi:uncharacterized repeat protein (TIGR02543 family)
MPPTTYSVTFDPGDHGTFPVLTADFIAEGAPTPAAPQSSGESGWRFTGWQPALAPTVTEDVIYVAQWELIVVSPTTWKVTFVDYDGTVIETQTVDEGCAAVAPSDPVRTGYTFTGWDKVFTNVTANITVKATYSVVSSTTYTVTFVTGDHGNAAPQVTSGLLAGDATPNPPQLGTVTSWRFIGWQPALAPHVTGNVTYTAQWELVAATPDLSTPPATQQPSVSVPAAQAPTILNVPAATGSTTLPSNTSITRTPSSDSAGTSGGSSGSADAADEGETLSDDQTPLTGGDGNTAGAAAEQNLLRLLLAFFLLLFIASAGGWLLLRYTRD